MLDVFISHSVKDALIADAAKHFLERRGIRCWKAPDNIVPGKTWEESIVQAISQASGILLIWSSHSQGSKQVCRELSLAATLEKIIIPFRIEPIQPDGTFAYYLTNTHWLDALSDDIEEELHILGDQIIKLLDIHTKDISGSSTLKEEAIRRDDKSEAATLNECTSISKDNRCQITFTRLQPRRFVGTELILSIKSMADARKTDLAVEAGFSKISEDGSLIVDLTSFYEELLDSARYKHDPCIDKEIRDLYEQAVCAEISGDLINAMHRYTYIIARDPNDGMSYYNRGCVRLKIGDYQDAIDDFTVAIQLKPNIENSYFYRAYAEMELPRGYPGGIPFRLAAIDDLEHYISNHDDHIDSYILLGKAACYLMDYEEAVRYLDRAIAIDPDISDCYTHRADAKTYLDDASGARKDYLKALSLNPNDEEATRGLENVTEYLLR